MGEPKESHVLAAYPFVVRVFGRGACATSMCVIDVFEIGTAWHRGLRWEKAPRAIHGATRLVFGQSKSLSPECFTHSSRRPSAFQQF